MTRLGLLGYSGALVASALLIAACGGTTGGGAPTGSATSAATATSGAAAPATATSSAVVNAASDVCALVKQDEASTVLGVTAGPADSTVGCAYKGPANGDPIRSSPPGE